MSHRHTVIEPSEGLTVLVGPNNCGKSAVITALQIMAYNENSTYITRHGEKECSVGVQTDDGQEIIWRRKRASTSYTINGKLFDRLRSGVPDELKRALRLPKVDLNTTSEPIDIHFGTQKQPVFLLNEPGRTAASFFAASSDASRLIEMQKVHKDKTRARKQDAKRLERETDALQDEINKLQGVEQLSEIIKQCEQEKLELAAAKMRTERLEEMIAKHRSLSNALKRYENISVRLKSLPEIPDFEPTKVLEAIVSKTKQLTDRREVLASRSAASQSLTQPPALKETRKLQSRIVEMQRLDRKLRIATRLSQALEALTAAPTLPDLENATKLVDETSGLRQQASKLFDSNVELEKSIQTVEQEIDQYVTENETCPNCMQPLNRDNVLKHLQQTGECGDD